MLDEDSAEVAGIKPKVLLEVGEKRTAKGAAKDPYIQKRCVGPGATSSDFEQNSR